MNTPKFQMRKMQRQMIKERDYRDGLERELACKVAHIAQKGTTASRERIRAVNLSAHSRTQQLPVCVNVLCCCCFCAETHVNQLQYRLEKLREEQGDREQMIREQISELETRNQT